MTKSTYKGSKLKQEQHEKNLGHILYLIKENYGIHRNLLKKLASKPGLHHMAPLTVERIIDELLKEGRIKLIKSDKSRYYLLDDWYTEVQYQNEFDKIIKEIKKVIETINDNFPSYHYFGKQEIIHEFESHVKNNFHVTPWYTEVLKSSDKEEDRCMRIIRSDSKKIRKDSVVKLLQNAETKFKEIKSLRKEISNIRKKINWREIPDDPIKYREQSVLLNQLSIENTNLHKSIQMLYGVSNSIREERVIRYKKF